MKRIHSLGGLVLLAVCLLAPGCAARPEYVAEPDKATKILEEALTAWRDGVSCEELRQRNPPVHVADERWLRGAELTSFTIGKGVPFGPSTRFEVTLEGPPPLGTKAVVYTVSTQPAISVALGD